MRYHMIRMITPVALACIVATGWGPAWAAPPGTTRVEEDWELVVLEPSTIEAGPQITTIMAPEPDPARTLMVFNLNFREEPFRPGGLQVECFHDGAIIDGHDSEKTGLLFQADETIRWTQRLSVAENVLTYEVCDGSSQSWGTFGSGGNLRMSVTTHVTSLATYDPGFSVEHSLAGWQANRIRSLRLLRVRYYAGDTLLGIEDTPRDVNLKW